MTSPKNWHHYRGADHADVYGFKIGGNIAALDFTVFSMFC